MNAIPGFVLATVIGLAFLGCSPRTESTPLKMAAPLPPNGTLITADVIAAREVDSTTLNILPRQPMVVLRVRILSVKELENEASFFDGKLGDVVTIYSKELTDAGLANSRIVATVVVMADERGTSFWARKITTNSGK